MVSRFTLLGLLLATVALAVPSSLVEAPIAHGHEDRQSRPISRVASRADAASPVREVYNSLRAGVFIYMHGGRSVFYVSGIITVPNICWITQGTTGSVYFSLLLDGNTCKFNSIQLGVGLEFIDHSGLFRYFAFYSVYNSCFDRIPTDRFRVDPGDKIYAWITVYGSTAILELHNAANNNKYTKSVLVTGSFFQREAGWLVIAPKDTEWVSFADVTFNIGARDTYGADYTLANVSTKYIIQRRDHNFTRIVDNNDPNTLTIEELVDLRAVLGM